MLSWAQQMGTTNKVYNFGYEAASRLIKMNRQQQDLMQIFHGCHHCQFPDLVRRRGTAG